MQKRYKNLPKPTIIVNFATQSARDDVIQSVQKSEI